MKKVKNLIILAISVIFSILSLSCASTKYSLNELSPVAVIDVEGNQRILIVDDEYKPDEDAGGILDNAINKMIDSNNPEILTAKDRINYADEYLRSALCDIGEVEVVDKETVIKNNTYKYSNKNFLKFMSTNYAGEGYVLGSSSFGAKSARLLIDELKASSLLSADFAFYKRFHKEDMYPVIVMKVNVIDKNGKKIITKTYTVEGSASVKTYGYYESYDKEQLVSLYPELIESVINKFIVEYM